VFLHPAKALSNQSRGTEDSASAAQYAMCAMYAMYAMYYS